MRMTDITIPPAALEAGARAAHDQWWHECADEACEPVENWREWDELDEWEQDSFRAQARAAFLAIVGAWEGAKIIRDDGRRQTYAIPAIILPLPQEASDE